MEKILYTETLRKLLQKIILNSLNCYRNELIYKYEGVI